MVTQQITLKLTTNRTHEAAQQRDTLLERGKTKIPQRYDDAACVDHENEAFQ